MIPFFFAILIFVPFAHSTAIESCVARNKTYTIADDKQCDKYWQCTKSAKLLERLCDDGFVYSQLIGQCDYPHTVQCGDRTILQPSQSTHPNCPRSNGFYPFPPSESCQKFYHCLEGQAYEKTCPEGVIFDDKRMTCIHPDMSHRADCGATAVLNFTCPNAANRYLKLRFGDHDRYPHSQDCRKYFICLKDGHPRIAGCPLGWVFNAKKGICDEPRKVPGCEGYYGGKDISNLVKESESEGFQFGVPSPEFFEKIKNQTEQLLKNHNQEQDKQKQEQA